MGRVQFVVFEKFASAYLFQIFAQEKLFDYLLIIYKWQFLSRFIVLLILTGEFKSKNSFTLSKWCMKTEQFLLPEKSSLYSHLNIEELDHKAKENLPSLRIRYGIFAKCFSSVWKTVSRV